MRRYAWLMLVVGVLTWVAWRAADAAEGPGDGSDGAAEKAAEAPAEAPAQETLAKGLYRFTPPAGWVKNEKLSTGDRAVYVTADYEGRILLEVLGPEYEVYPKMGVTVSKKLRQTRQKEGVLVTAPKVERDKRFDIRIHERYKRGEGGERTADGLHLYKQVGPRLLLVTATSVSEDEEEVKEAHTKGEEVLLSVEYTKAKRNAKAKAKTKAGKAAKAAAKTKSKPKDKPKSKVKPKGKPASGKAGGTTKGGTEKSG